MTRIEMNGENMERHLEGAQVLAGGLQLEVVGRQRGLHHVVDAVAVLQDVPHLVQVRVAQAQAVLALLWAQAQRHLHRRTAGRGSDTRAYPRHACPDKQELQQMADSDPCVAVVIRQ